MAPMGYDISTAEDSNFQGLCLWRFYFDGKYKNHSKSNMDTIQGGNLRNVDNIKSCEIETEVYHYIKSRITRNKKNKHLSRNKE